MREKEKRREDEIPLLQRKTERTTYRKWREKREKRHAQSGCVLVVGKH